MTQSTYTLSLPREEWRQVKLLATLRGQTIRSFVRQLLAEEVERARLGGEFASAATQPRLTWQ